MRPGLPSNDLTDRARAHPKLYAECTHADARCCIEAANLYYFDRIKLCNRAVIPYSHSPLADHIVSIIGGSAKKQMGGTNTRPIVAEVEHATTVRDWSIEKNPRNTVSTATSQSIVFTIAIPPDVAGPLKTSITGDFYHRVKIFLDLVFGSLSWGRLKSSVLLLFNGKTCWHKQKNRLPNCGRNWQMNKPNAKGQAANLFEVSFFEAFDGLLESISASFIWSTRKALWLG